MAADPRSGLVIVGCSRRKLDTAQPVPALELYQGWCFPQLRARIARGPAYRDRVLILSALHGLIPADTPITPYDQQLTPRRAAQLRPTTAATLASRPASRVLLLLEPRYRDALPDLPNTIEINDAVRDWPKAAAVLDSWGWP
ncbi:hypothetical protein DP939_22165 [Spongiactinospora rosea]|uniref:DUF6884 domain-containing protein n=1 Tax=Spongiactinospora rosea TaxID=2248750 RepID=A0A366LWY1_9ACTN|nr:DUF6884 domain-containing protein [Spongiactinospora rosea]RBQ18070.1 hypothetical protein DP939_22165 [Spongiactinospora rosea]